MPYAIYEIKELKELNIITNFLDQFTKKNIF